jgi:hypothetical protein
MQSIRNFFHTDTWWGKTAFIILVYTLYWCVFYGSFFLFPYGFFQSNSSSEYITWLLLSYLFIFVPFLSFKLALFIRRITLAKYIYVINTVFILLSLIIFLGIDLVISTYYWFSF